MNSQGLSAKLLKIFIIGALFISIGQIKVGAVEKEIDINTNPSRYLFKVSNLVPGDWMPRDITISNDGQQDFRYMAVLGKKKSVKGLLEELDLLVKKDEEVLYEGKMDEFDGFTPRNLVIGDSETIFFQVTMPYDLGNAYQSSGAEVEILFIAEALGEPGNGDPGKENPGEEEPVEEKPNVEEPGEEDQNNPSNGDSDEGNTSEEDPNEENPFENSTDDGESNGENPEETSDEESVEVDGEVAESETPNNQIVVSPEMREKLLPKTATNTYNILLIGSLLLVTGGILSIFYFKRLRRH